MDTEISSITDLLFAGFGIYSILFALGYHKLSDAFIEEVDRIACFILSVVGVVFIVTCIFTMPPEHKTEYENYVVINRAFGPYWASYWFILLIPVVLTQLFWIERLRKMRLLRAFVGLLLLVSPERLILVISSFHQDFLPTSFETPMADVLTNWVLGFWMLMTFIGLLYAVRIITKK